VRALEWWCGEPPRLVPQSKGVQSNDLSRPLAHEPERKLGGGNRYDVQCLEAPVAFKIGYGVAGGMLEMEVVIGP